MADLGITIGNSLTGYYRGRKMREDAEDRDTEREWERNRRERALRRENVLDPIEEEQAQMGIRRGRADLDYTERTLDPRVNAVERQDRTGGYQEEDYLHDRPIRRRALERQDRMGQASEEDANFSRPLQRRSMQRQDRAGEMQMEEYQQYGDAKKNYQEARNAVAVFLETGNAKGIEDFYEKIPDGLSVKITKVGNDLYQMDRIDQQGKIVQTTRKTQEGDPLTKKALAERTEKYFASQMNVDAMSGGYSSGSRSTGGLSGISGIKSPFGRTSGSMPSAYIQRVDDVAQTLMASGMSPVEARMQAHAEASYKARMAPDEAVREFYADMLKKLMPSQADVQYLDPDAREQAFNDAKAQARKMTQQFHQDFFSGLRKPSAMGSSDSDQDDRGGGLPDGDRDDSGAGSGADVSNIPDAARRHLMAHPDLKDAFEAKYGPGTAEAVLNAR